jgi:hypothetical protein
MAFILRDARLICTIRDGLAIARPARVRALLRQAASIWWTSGEIDSCRHLSLNIPQYILPRYLNEADKTVPCTWIVVHSSGSDQDGIVLLPELDKELAERLAAKA